MSHSTALQVASSTPRSSFSVASVWMRSPLEVNSVIQASSRQEELVGTAFFSAQENSIVVASGATEIFASSAVV